MSTNTNKASNNDATANNRTEEGLDDNATVHVAQNENGEYFLPDQENRSADFPVALLKIISTEFRSLEGNIQEQRILCECVGEGLLKTLPARYHLWLSREERLIALNTPEAVDIIFSILKNME